jgi:predicted transcriptional regulator
MSNGTLTQNINSLDCLKRSKNLGEQAVYKAFLDDSDGVQPREIAAKRGFHETTIAIVINRLKVKKLVYISHWKLSNKNRQCAVYKVGNKKDAVMPIKKTLAAKKLIDEASDFEKLCKRYDAINKALVPTRNTKQQRVANLRYLNHIQGIR